MELVPKRFDSDTLADWRAAWEFRPNLPKVVQQLSKVRNKSVVESVMRAAYFAAGKLHDDDFHLFSNGGQPLLKRQRETWLDEVLFHSPPTGVLGHYCPAAIELIVHFEPLRDIRAKVSRSSTMVPATVARVNIGQLRANSMKALWNLEYEESITEIGNLLSVEGLAWIDDLCDPISLEDRVIAGTLPFVDDATGLELVLATGRKLGARRVVDAWRGDPVRGPRLERALNRLSRQFGPVYREDDTWGNVAVLCISYDLLSKQLIRR